MRNYLVSCCFCRTVGLVARECFWLGEGENRDTVILAQLLRYRLIDKAIPIAVKACIAVIVASIEQCCNSSVLAKGNTYGAPVRLQRDRMPVFTS
jgi:hypothetical protein